MWVVVRNTCTCKSCLAGKRVEHGEASSPGVVHQPGPVTRCKVLYTNRVPPCLALMQIGCIVARPGGGDSLQGTHDLLRVIGRQRAPYRGCEWCVHLKQTKKYFRVGVERPRDDHMLYRGQWLSLYVVHVCSWPGDWRSSTRCQCVPIVKLRDSTTRDQERDCVRCIEITASVY